MPLIPSGLPVLSDMTHIATQIASSSLVAASEGTPAGISPMATPSTLNPHAIATTGGQMAILKTLGEILSSLQRLCTAVEGGAALTALPQGQPVSPRPQPVVPREDQQDPTLVESARLAGEIGQRVRASRAQRDAQTQPSEVRRSSTALSVTTRLREA